MEIPTLVAHRGYAKNFPENTLEGIEAAIVAGACMVEIDIQCTADGIPVLIHDEMLNRTSSESGHILKMQFERVRMMNAGEPERFGHQFSQVRIPSLQDFVALMQKWPNMRAFIEIKEESLSAFGIPHVLDRVNAILEPVRDRCIVISYDLEALEYTRDISTTSIGWILKKWDAVSCDHAHSLNPDFIISNYKKIPDDAVTLWVGPWQWVLYEVDTPDLALELAELGVGFIETMAIKEMLADPELYKRGCFSGVVDTALM